MVSEDVMEARSRRLGLQHGNSIDQAVFLSEDKHVMAFSRTKMCPARDASDWDADVVKVGRTVLTDTVKRNGCYFKLYSLWHWEPMKHVAKRCVRICQHQRPNRQQRSEPSEVDGRLVKRRRTERRCSNQLDWR